MKIEYPDAAEVTPAFALLAALILPTECGGSTKLKSSSIIFLVKELVLELLVKEYEDEELEVDW